MKTENSKDPWQLLQAVEKMELNPFLFTRIEEKIQSRRENSTSTSKARLVLTAVSVFVLLNIFIISRGSVYPPQQENLLETFYLNSNTSLYK
jgi:hypothetical protein